MDSCFAHVVLLFILFHDLDLKLGLLIFILVKKSCSLGCFRALDITMVDLDVVVVSNNPIVTGLNSQL